MRVYSTLISLLLAVPLCRAVFRDEVGDIDFHHSLIGIPQPDRTFFHQPRKDEKASLLYTLSDVGIIGAVNPGNGAVVWRQPLSRTNLTTDRNGFLRAGDGENWLAAAHGSGVHAWNAVSGRNIWWTDFAGSVKDLEIMELTVSGEKDVLALFEDENSVVARRLSGTTGKVLWEHRERGHEVPLQVSTDSAKIFVVSLQGPPSGYVVKVVVLDSLTGQRLQEAVLNTGGAVESPNDVMFVGANSAASIVAWTDKARTSLKVNLLGTSTAQEFPLGEGVEGVTIHAPHLVQSEPHFLVHSRTSSGNKAQVFHIDKNGKIAVAHDLPHLAGSGAFSVSSDGSNVYFVRITEGEVLLMSSTSHEVLARWPIDSTTALEPLFCSSEVLKKTDGSFAVRSAALTRSGDWVLVRTGNVDWIRPEGLTGAVAAAWAEIPENEELAKILEEEAHATPWEAYKHRLERDIRDLQYLPDYLAQLPKRILGSILGTDLVSKNGPLSRDTFGFHKIAILATSRGRLYGLDFGNHGQIAWSLDAFVQSSGQRWDVKGMLVDNHKGVVTVRGSQGESITVHVDTGNIVEIIPPGASPPIQSTVVVSDATGEDFLLPIRLGGNIDAGKVQSVSEASLIMSCGSNGQLKGIILHPTDSSHGTLAWTFFPPTGQKIISIALRSPHDPIASIGRVLGDRRVLYKYLDPNTFVVATIDPAKLILTTYLLDGASGQILASSIYKGVDPTKDICCTIAENWFVCSFFGEYKLSDGTGRTLKGYQIAVSDLFESLEPNDRGPLGNTVNVSSLDPLETPVGPHLPAVVSQAFVISSAVNNLAVTQTRQGITVRNVVAYLPETGGIALLPRQILEPRRPVGRDPTAQEMEAEALIKYMPAIEIDPRSVITHGLEVLGVQQIISSQTGVESTSLILAFGVDVFGTRVAPSMAFDILGKSFNKLSMVLTVVALFAGVVVLKPLVRKKQIDLRWGAQG